MYYNLESFSEEIRNIRKNLNLTQKDISFLSGVNVDTLSKIENGKVIPKQETLDILSMVLKKDLNTILLKYRFNNYSKFHQLKNSIEKIIENGSFIELKNQLDNLNAIIHKDDMNSYFSRLTKQLYFLVKAIFLKISCDDYEEALLSLIESIKITSPDFSLTEYNNFVYNNTEIRILMNIALILNKKESINKCLELLQFCHKNLEPDDWELNIRVVYNLSYTYHRLFLHDSALYFANLGIKTCIENRSLYCLALLYTRKGIAEHLLNYDNYINSLEKAKHLYEISDQNELKSKFKNACKEHYNIDID